MLGSHLLLFIIVNKLCILSDMTIILHHVIAFLYFPALIFRVAIVFIFGVSLLIFEIILAFHLPRQSEDM